MLDFIFDAGHGGKDPGAIGPTGKHEADFVLDICMKTGRYLKEQGYSVGYTRTTNEFLELYERANISNSVNARYFLSFHINSVIDALANGLEAYCFDKGGAGEALARNILEALLPVMNINNRGVKTANFAVLRRTIAPAALIELGFISNAEQEAKLAQEAYRDSLALAIAKGCIKTIGGSYKESTPTPVPNPSPAPQPKPQYDFASLQREFVNQGFGNLAVDNIPGPKTLAAAPLVKQGARGNITRWIQNRLIALGYSLKYGADGIFGEGTRQAVMAFQRDNGLSADGIVGKNTWRKLLGL